MPKRFSTATSRRSMRRASASLFMVVAQQMQGTVNHQVRPMGLDGLVLLPRLRAHDAGADHQIPERPWRGLRTGRAGRQLRHRERQHIGGFVATPIRAFRRCFQPV